MATKPLITVTREERKDGPVHVCIPTDTTVMAGDLVEWKGDEVFLVDFSHSPNGGPFTKTTFRNGDQAIVKADPGKPKDHFTAQFTVKGDKLKKTEGDIIIGP